MPNKILVDTPLAFKKMLALNRKKTEIIFPEWLFLSDLWKI
jgi:hypothetical protein